MFDSVDRSIKLKLILIFGTRKKRDGYNTNLRIQAIYNVLQHYNKAYILVSQIHADDDFRIIMIDLEDNWDIKMNFYLPAEHVPDIERVNRVFQERFRVNL